MGNCKIAAATHYGLIKLTCDEVRDQLESLKEGFRLRNGTDAVIKAIGRDRKYDEYCMQFENFLSKCTCNDIPLKCAKCAPEDHEGVFCRCEDRNIALAKQLRARRYQKQTDNKGQAAKACSLNVASEKTSKEDAVL